MITCVKSNKAKDPASKPVSTQYDRLDQLRTDTVT